MTAFGFFELTKKCPGLLRVLDDLEQYSQTHGDDAAVTAVRECRGSLDKLITKMDGLEASFDRIAERSCEQSPFSSHFPPQILVHSTFCLTYLKFSQTL
jgi:hypothetical protein